MDITDISKVASRKRMNTDAEKLREKVSRETAKIIKLKVAQDTAYWDLKEKLQQVEGAHERLQQNMVEVQMQHEAISSHYQHELRLRPDTLNKVAGARDLCDVLEEYGERLRRGVARCRADRAALGAAYDACGARVRGLAARRRGLCDAARRAAAAREAEARRLRDALQQLGAARARGEALEAERRRLAADVQRGDEAAAALRADGERRAREAEAQRAELERTVAHREKEAGRLQRAAAELRARLDVGERESRAAQQELSRQLTDAIAASDDLQKALTSRVDEIKHLEIVIKDKTQHEENMETEINAMKQHISKIEAEKLKVEEELNKVTQECSVKSAAVDELSSVSQAAQAQLADARAALLAQREADAKRTADTAAAAAARERELDARSDTIARLMTDLKAESDARARADAGLAALRRRADGDRAAAAARETALAATVQDKDAELRAQLAVVLDARAEKERLQQKIQGMQNTIDNIQKELTGRLAAPKAAADAGEPPELDGGPRRPDDTMLYNFLSDGSVDGDALDPREVGRRFQALQRGTGPAARQESISLSQMKDDLKIKSRTFFKNKRFDIKAKKLK